jgi:hypothetical protein
MALSSTWLSVSQTNCTEATSSALYHLALWSAHLMSFTKSTRASIPAPRKSEHQQIRGASINKYYPDCIVITQAPQTNEGIFFSTQLAQKKKTFSVPPTQPCYCQLWLMK